MNINATLFGQAITFAIFIWFTMKFVWPPIMAAMNEREKTIADGLAAAKKGEESLDEAHHKLDEKEQELDDKEQELEQERQRRAELEAEIARLRAGPPA